MAKKDTQESVAKQMDAGGMFSYIDVGPKPSGFFKRMKWRRKIRKARKRLRKDLKAEGITKRAEFEEVARELGLGLDKNNLFFAWLFWRFVWIKGAAGLTTLLAAAGILLGSLFAYSFVTDEAGSFTVNLTPKTIKSGLALSQTDENWDHLISRLISDEMSEVSNISIKDIPEDIYKEAEGPHNGKHYMAYTFYLYNAGEYTQAYQYSFNMDESMFGADQAVWVMLYEGDGEVQDVDEKGNLLFDEKGEPIMVETDKQIVYATADKDGEPTRLIGYGRPYFYDSAYAPEDQYYYDAENDEWGIKTTPFVDEETVAKGIVQSLEPGEYKKYTVVLWLEGDDEDCTDEIFGGYAKYSMEFDLIDDGHSFMDDFLRDYRTEYKLSKSEDYMDVEKKAKMALEEKKRARESGTVVTSANSPEATPETDN